MLHSICQQIWKTQQWPQGWKRSVFPKKGNAKECSNYYTITLILHASKVILKILQVRLQQYMNHEHSDFKLDLEKAEEPQIIANICWIIPLGIRAREFQKNIYFFSLLTMPKPWTVWITTHCGQFLKRWEYQTT